MVLNLWPGCVNSLKSRMGCNEVFGLHSDTNWPCKLLKTDSSSDSSCVEGWERESWWCNFCAICVPETFHDPLVEKFWLTARLLTIIVCALACQHQRYFRTMLVPYNVWELSILCNQLQIVWFWHNCGPLTVHEYRRYVSQLCNHKIV